SYTPPVKLEFTRIVSQDIDKSRRQIKEIFSLINEYFLK
ncbi:unnamed protein product, partial [marine sediment metagenome]